MEQPENSNFQLLRDCLSIPLIEKSNAQAAKKTRKTRGNGRRRSAIKPVMDSSDQESNDAEELAEFIDVCPYARTSRSSFSSTQYLATEIFTNLPQDLRILTYSTYLDTPSLQTKYSDPLPPVTAHQILDPLPQSITDTLQAYSLLPPSTSTAEFLTLILTTYISTLLTAPPAPYLTRDLTTECEICQRSWIPLTYHHLIPKGVHAKVLKRGWHTKDQLNNVAWLCRACHNFVHRIASLEELAREWYSVERLVERDDVKAWATWVSRVRWKAR